MGDTSFQKEGYIATLDIGTSSVRCLIINHAGDPVSSSTKPVSYSIHFTNQLAYES